MEPCLTVAAPGAAPGLPFVKDAATLRPVRMPQQSSRPCSEVVPCETSFRWAVSISRSAHCDQSSEEMLFLLDSPVKQEASNEMRGLKHLDGLRRSENLHLVVDAPQFGRAGDRALPPEPSCDEMRMVT